VSQSTVYVLDDDQSVRTALVRLIESVGLQVRTFASASEFLALDLNNHPGCLVLDMRLPGLSGLQLQQKLSREGASIPIIFITAHGDVPMCVRAMKAGALDFLQKPFNDQDLLDAISRALATDQNTSLKRAEKIEIEKRLRRLTLRERDVLRLVVAGLPNKNIAAQLEISEKTVKVHRGHLMRKMEADSLPELVRLADKAGFIELDPLVG
jgi:RNA polymerase sigma factor (sigma-70 family)